MTVVSLVGRARVRDHAARALLARQHDRSRDALLESAERRARRNLNRARILRRHNQSLRRELADTYLRLEASAAENQRLTNLIAGYETRTAGNDRNPIFRGRCYLCGDPVAPGSSLYCAEHLWAGDQNWGQPNADPSGAKPGSSASPHAAGKRRAPSPPSTTTAAADTSVEAEASAAAGRT